MPRGCHILKKNDIRRYSLLTPLDTVESTRRRWQNSCKYCKRYSSINNVMIKTVQTRMSLGRVAHAVVHVRLSIRRMLASPLPSNVLHG